MVSVRDGAACNDSFKEEDDGTTSSTLESGLETVWVPIESDKGEVCTPTDDVPRLKEFDESTSTR